MTTLSEWIETNLHITPLFQARLLASLLVLAGLWLARWLVLRAVARRTDNPATLYNWRKGLEYVTLVIGVLWIGRIWFTGISSVATYLGLLSAGLAIALQDPLGDFVGWIFIIWRRPLEVGDRVQIGEFAGDVVDIRFFQFTLLEIRNWVDADQSTGRLLHVPNRKIFSDVLASYTQGFGYIWHEIAVDVTFESNWSKAKELLQAIANEHSAHHSEAARQRVREVARRYAITYDNLTPIVYTAVEASGVRLTMRFLCEPRNRRSSSAAIWEAVLRAFAEQPDIDLAYPTQRLYFQPAEDQRPAAAMPHEG